MANEVLTRTPTSTGNKKKFTWAGWIKRNSTNSSGGNFFQGILGVGTVDGAEDTFTFSGDRLRLRCEIGTDIQTDNKYRDIGNWIHVMMVVDTTLYDPDHRCIFYVNGIKSDSMSSEGDITKDANLRINDLSTHYLGEFPRVNEHLDGQICDVFFIDGQALTPDVFGFYKDGDGYMSSGTTNATDFRPGQWMPHAPRVIKKSIERSGGFGVNGFYLPMNDSSNPGADFHCAPNSIITLKGEDLPQPQNGAPTTSDAYVSQLRQEVSTLGFDGVVKFDGDGDYLSLSTTSDFAFGTGDFTVEFWAWIESSKSTTLQPIFDNDYNSAGGLAIAIRHSDSRIFVGDNGSGLNLCQFNAPFALNYWNHFAVVADSGTYKAFVNGTSCSLGSGSATVVNTSKSSGTTEIGRLVGQTSIDAAAFISNLRVVKGTALYTANFTAPTEPLTNVTNTKLLCCNSSTSATAATVTPGTITANGNAFATRNELTGSIVLAVPGISTSTSANLISNGNFDSSDISDWVTNTSSQTWVNGQLQVTRSGGTGATTYKTFTTEVGKRYTVLGTVNSSGSRGDINIEDGTGWGGSTLLYLPGTNGEIRTLSGSFTAASTTTTFGIGVDTNGTTIYVDNIVVKQEDAPRDYSADIKGSGSNKTLTPDGNAGVGYELGNYYGSALTSQANGGFSFANNDFQFGTGDFTFECWFYMTSNNSAIRSIFDTRTTDNSSAGVFLGIQTNSQLYTYAWPSGTAVVYYGTPAINQWHHVALVRNGSIGTVYLNGVAVGTSDVSGSNYTQGGGTLMRPASVFGTSYHFLGHVQDARVYKGIAKYKGGFDVPKPYTPVGIEAFRTTADTCKNNFATLNPLLTYSNSNTYTNGNLKAVATTNDQVTTGNMAFSSGKWYWETRIYNDEMIGLAIPSQNIGQYPGQNVNGFSYHRSGGVYYDGTVNYGAGWSFNTYHVIGIAVDWTNKRAYWHVDGVWANSADPSAGTGFYDITTNASNVAASVDAIPAWRTRAATASERVSVNFGQNPSFGGELTAGTFTDDSGKGLFKYAPPTGFLALCEDNLPTPAIADPGDYMRTVLYAGDGNSGRSITGVGFQPDLVWLKSRTNNASHRLSDSVRGVNKQLMSNTTEVEATFTTMLTSFDSDGFTLGDNAGINGSGYTNVAWCWKAGGAAVSNTDGTITSQVSANQTAGFSIVSYDGSGNVNDTVGHSLGKTPSFIILKARTQAYFWRVYHSHFGTSPTEGLYLNSTVISAVHDEHGGIASVTPTTFGFGTDGTNTLTGVNKSGDTYIAYCWTEIEGYSKFGSYVGNGSADGPFVYCGFKPAFLMIKLVTGSQRDWHIYDSSRNPTNPVGLNLRPSSASTDTDEPGIDFLSNGFKIRSNYVFSNESGQTIIFMAFAESPFQTANAK